MNGSKPKVVVVTGASAGVGRATVQAFAKRGAHIGLVARSRDGLEGARKEVEAAGGKALVLPTDVSDHDQVEAAAESVEKEFGPIDIWVNDAMASILSPFIDIKPEEFRRVTEVSYLGYVYGTMAALRRMKPRDRGTIVQVGSALAYRSIPLQSAYCGAKSAIRGFTDSLRTELIHDGSNIKLTMVQLPAVNTPQFDWIKNKMPHKSQPVPPIFQPEVIAEAIVWVTEHYRRELYIGGSTVEAILGNKITPGLLDVYLAKTGYSSQQTDEPENHSRQSNLWEPLPGDHGAHGRFDEKSLDHSTQLWATKNQDWLALALGASVACVAFGAYLGYQAQPQQSAARHDDEDKITDTEVNSEILKQVNRGSKKDKFQILMGLAQLGWKALTAEPRSSEKMSASLDGQQ